MDSEVQLDNEHVRLRTLALLRGRGRLTNSEIRRFSGVSRVQAYRMVKELEAAGEVRLVGHGRGAHVVPSIGIETTE